MAQRRTISSGSTFEREFGYARAVVDADYVFVSGCIGMDYEAMRLADGPVAQCELAIANADAALTEAGSSLADVVRIQYIAKSREDFLACRDVLGRTFADVRPAATMWIADLLDPDAVFEIQVTARLSHGHEHESVGDK